MRARCKDAYGELLKWELQTGEPSTEIIEREDGYIDTGSQPGTYFLAPKKWSPIERRSLKRATGRVLDIGCGAGRHALYLQERGLRVTAIDGSPGAVTVARKRGVRHVLHRPIEELSRFQDNSFETVIMMGNNFGLLGSLTKARRLLGQLDRITTPNAQIIAATRDPYDTDRRVHLDYHAYNRKRGRMGGQIRFRVRFARCVGPWFEYLLVSQDEMHEILVGTQWEVRQFFAGDGSNYIAHLRKRSDR